jgi:hypothetical protein
MPSLSVIFAHVDALELAHEAGLLDRKQLVPDAIEVGQGFANGCRPADLEYFFL